MSSPIYSFGPLPFFPLLCYNIITGIGCDAAAVKMLILGSLLK